MMVPWPKAGGMNNEKASPTHAGQHFMPQAYRSIVTLGKRVYEMRQVYVDAPLTFLWPNA
jgi:hypothetical protein